MLAYHWNCGHVHEKHEDCVTVDSTEGLPVLTMDAQKATSAMADAIRLWLMVPEWADPYFLRTRPTSGNWPNYVPFTGE